MPPQNVPLEPLDRSRWPAILALTYLALLLATVALMAPGRMGNDELDMFRQAHSGQYHDWHSPLIPWIWRMGLTLAPGALSVHVLGAALYFLGWYLVAFELFKRGRLWATWAVTAMSLFPPIWMAIGISGSKDTFLSATLLLSLGLTARVARVGWKPGLVAATLLLLMSALVLRQNALFAVAPLMAFLLYPIVRRTLRSAYLALPAAFVLACATTLILFFTITAAVHYSLQVQRTNAMAILYLFDLAGTSKRVGVDVTGGALGPEFFENILSCFDLETADNYAHYGRCGQTWKRMFAGTMEEPGDVEKKSQLARLWRNAVIAHPVAYFKHRFVHFIRTVGWTRRIPGSTFSLELDFQNPPGDRREFSAFVLAIDHASNWLVATTIMQPYLWLVFGVICLALLPFYGRSEAGGLAAASFASAVCYGLGYFLVGVSFSFRYFHWMVIAEMIGLVWLVVAMLELRESATPQPKVP